MTGVLQNKFYLKNCKYKNIFCENGGGKRGEINEFWSHITVAIDILVPDSCNSKQTNEMEGEIATAVQA